MKILIVEDDVKTAVELKQGLEASGYETHHSPDGLDGLMRLSAEEFDAAIVDIMMPGCDGLTMVERLRAGRQDLPVIFLSARNTVDDRVIGLRKGGDDYLVKPFAFPELEARLEALIRRRPAGETQTSLSLGDLKVDLIGRKVERSHKRIELSAKEFALLEYLLRNCGRVLSKSMILEEVWDCDFDPQTNIVEAKICRLRDKIDKGFDVKLIHTIRGVGYLMEL